MNDRQRAQDVQRELLIRIQTEGVQAAYEASLAVCNDPKAPAPARATASATIFRVAGYFDRKEGDQAKEPHEMSAEELAIEIARMSRQAQKTDRDIFD
ncbi:hypothetical protein [Rhizobium leguminosarum]|uniref:hypothetical protein n=1 Tax=Rhizobium leguminosarum TaxID=384 RepID=UPI0024B3550E|nr:hypothetical protein [Rhizobium leguminosarum]WHO77464.1 hypothetical protein QMO81_000092 [Rhizobium leguminosarum]